MKTLFIVNPAAGNGRGDGRWASFEARFLEASPGSKVWRTERPGHAVELVAKALEGGFEAIVAVGGDGTAGEVVDGYLKSPVALRKRAALGTWPVGSGCDLARHLGLKADESFLEVLSKPVIRRLDAGLVEFSGEGGPARRHFLNVVSLGIGGEIGRKTQEKGKRWGGTLSYLLTSLSCLLRAKPYAMTLLTDGKAEPGAPYHLVAVANTSTTGGGMRIAPQADAQDGLLDLVSVGALSRLSLLQRFPLIYSGGHIGTAGVSHRKIRRLEIASEGTVYLNIDGEAVGTLPAVFQVLPAAVPFLCPT
ncbi:MAG: diacylglycerol kinase family lipid kinase [Elusimicrobia bacterium]|nr:diacylglycerol kinase family lipid kinase [Elusimicrobiota bacterium]